MTDTEVKRWTLTERIRASDLNPAAQLGPAGLCRLAETLRWRLFEQDLPGARVVVRSQCVEMLQAARFGEAITLSMWMSGIGRTSVTLMQEAARSDEPTSIIARGAVTLVWTDGAGRPTPVPEAAHAWVHPESPLSSKRDLPTQAPESAFEHRILVQHHDLDVLQHVNQARYVDFIESTRQAATAAGAYGDLASAQSVRRLDIAYDGEVRLGAEIRTRTWMSAANSVVVLSYDAAAEQLINRAEIELA